MKTRSKCINEYCTYMLSGTEQPVSPWSDDETLICFAIVEGRLEVLGVRFDEVAAPMFRGVPASSSSPYSMFLSSEQTIVRAKFVCNKGLLLRDYSMARTCLIFEFTLHEKNCAKSGSMSFTGSPLDAPVRNRFPTRLYRVICRARSSTQVEQNGDPCTQTTCQHCPCIGVRRNVIARQWSPFSDRYSSTDRGEIFPRWPQERVVPIRPHCT